MPDPLPPHRSLMVIEDISLISPDTRKRILALRAKNAGELQALTMIKKMLWPAAGGSLALSILIAIADTGIALIFIFLAIAIGIFGLISADKMSKKIAELRSISFPCPRCHEVINLALPWACGNCKHPNAEDESELAIPFAKCLEPNCSHPQQAAYQCPACRHHIVLNQTLYLEHRSYQSPFKYAARYIGDTNTPIPAKPVPASTQETSFFDDDGQAFEH